MKEDAYLKRKLMNAIYPFGYLNQILGQAKMPIGWHYETYADTKERDTLVLKG